MKNQLSKQGCNICPRECGSPRTTAQPGECGASGGFASFRVAKMMAHMWEEPFISGRNGAGTVFFCGCHLGCIYCQNHMISRPMGDLGQVMTVNELAEKLGDLIDIGVHNIELVSASHYTLQVIELIKLLKQRGCSLPIIWNSSAYEKRDTLRGLEGLIDIYMPDIKYADNELALRFSHTADYVEYSEQALKEMIRQRPTANYDKNGLMLSGIAVRHLVLPGCHNDSMTVIDSLSEMIDPATPLSLMSQYTPVKDLFDSTLSEEKQLQRRLTTYEYNKVIDYAVRRGFTNIYGQELSSANSNYTPDFTSFFPDLI